MPLLGGPVGSHPVKLNYLYDKYEHGSLSILANPVDGQTWVNFLSGTNAGYVDAGEFGARVVPDVGYGQQVMLQMVAWEDNNVWFGHIDNWFGAFYTAISSHQLAQNASE